MSETVKTKTELKNQEVCVALANRLGHTVLGQGKHKLYNGSAVGLGIKFKDWQYPIIVQADGTVSYDNYHGSWGSDATLKQFVDGYTLEAAIAEARNQGWICEQQGNKVVVNHPSGATLTVTAEGIDAQGFSGSGCTEAVKTFSDAIGKVVETISKVEGQEVTGVVNVAESGGRE